MKILVKVTEHPDLAPEIRWCATVNFKRGWWGTAAFLCSFKPTKEEAILDIRRKVIASIEEPEVTEIDV